jgi:hypothetical protein
VGMKKFLRLMVPHDTDEARDKSSSACSGRTRKLLLALARVPATRLNKAAIQRIIFIVDVAVRALDFGLIAGSGFVL